jgi:beta propeller repeat protein
MFWNRKRGKIEVFGLSILLCFVLLAGNKIPSGKRSIGGEGSSTSKNSFPRQMGLKEGPLSIRSPGRDVPICTEAHDQHHPAIYGEKIVWEDWRNRNGDIYMYDLSTGAETPICTAAHNQGSPAIYGDKIVWADNRYMNWDIYMYDLSTGSETAICTEAHDQSNPAIYGDKIVWEDYRDGNGDIYMYDLSSGALRAICREAHNQRRPKIYGDKIVWEDNRNGNWDIYMYDLSTNTETAISRRAPNQEYPAIYGDKIVWQEEILWGETISDYNIYMYDLSTNTETGICTNPDPQLSPAIYGDKIVWLDERLGQPDIYMYDLSTHTETPVYYDIYTQSSPAIYGDKIVWKDNRNGNWDIYMFDLSRGAEFAICTDAHYQGSPAIYEDKYGVRIVWEDDRNGNWDIYIYDLSTRQERIITAHSQIQCSPVIYGGKIVWTDYRNSPPLSPNPDIYMYEFSKADMVAPLISIISPMPRSRVSRFFPLSYTVDDENFDPLRVDLFIDEGLPLKPTLIDGQFLSIVSLSAGEHKFRVRAWDSWDNFAEASASFQVASPNECVPPPQKDILFLAFPFQPQPNKLQSIIAYDKACIWNGIRYIFSDSPDFPKDLTNKVLWFKLPQPFDPLQVKPLGYACSAEQEVSLQLNKGWEAFGLPWSYPLPISGLWIEDKMGNRVSFSEANKLVGLVIFRWDGEKYVSAGLQQGMENTLYPWFGYWIRVKEDCKLIFPKEPWNVKVKRAPSDEGFSLPIKAVFADGSSEDVYIGMGKLEITSPFPPSPPYSQATRRLSIIKNGELLYVDIRKERGKQEWRLAAKGDATLFFPNLSYLPKGWQAILKDGNKRYYLKTTPAIKVEGDKELGIEIGEGLITPLLISMVQTSKVRGGVSISWSVNLDCQVKVEVKATDGRLVRDLGIRSSSAGINSVLWDGCYKDGRALPAGIYIVELTARDEMHQMVKAIRMVNLR